MRRLTEWYAHALRVHARCGPPIHGGKIDVRPPSKAAGAADAQGMRETPNVRINVRQCREGYRAVNATTCNDCSVQRRCQRLALPVQHRDQVIRLHAEEIEGRAVVIKSANIELQ
jgi:hypothetical protein